MDLSTSSGRFVWIMKTCREPPAEKLALLCLSEMTGMDGVIRNFVHKELALRINLSEQTTSDLLGRLVTKGWLSRSYAPRVGRVQVGQSFWQYRLNVERGSDDHQGRGAFRKFHRRAERANQ